VKAVPLWAKERRPQILQMFYEKMFGFPPTQSAGLHIVAESQGAHALKGLAARRQIVFAPSDNRHGLTIHLLL
jgi:hypothetical protein